MTTLEPKPVPSDGLQPVNTIEAEAVPATVLPLAHDEPLITTQEEERISIASNWTLVWWRFRKNKLAVVSSVILLIPSSS